MAGAAAGAAASAVSMPIQSAGNNIAFGDPFMSPQDYVLGVAGGAFLGGSINGGIAGYNGKNFWSGNNRLGGSNMFSFTNSPKTELGKMPTLNNSQFRTEPKNLTEQLTLKEAMSGKGKPIMTDKINDPKWLGWDKMQHIHKSHNGSTNIHYWRNIETGEIKGFKFK